MVNNGEKVLISSKKRVDFVGENGKFFGEDGEFVVMMEKSVS
jgi:hypothetical protein